MVGLGEVRPSSLILDLTAVLPDPAILTTLQACGLRMRLRVWRVIGKYVSPCPHPLPSRAPAGKRPAKLVYGVVSDRTPHTCSLPYATDRSQRGPTQSRGAMSQ
jgi:hypothetical protein